MIELKYQGQEVSRDSSSKTFKETYIGDQNSIDAKISELHIGYLTEGKGYLSSWRKTQDSGPHYVLQLEYRTSFANASNLDQNEVGKLSAQLSTRNLQIPLEKATGYKTYWNYYLAGKNTSTLPAWATTATDTIIQPPDNKTYKWIKSLAQLDVDNGWKPLQKPKKPGVEYFDQAYFVVSINKKYNTASAAGNAISRNLNVVTSPPETFGLGGQWKLDEAQVRYQGRYWLASNTYTRAVDYWDGDLYQGGTIVP